MNKMYEQTLPDSDISFVSTGRPSIDRMFTPFDNLESGLTPRLSTISEFDNKHFGSIFAGNKSIDITSSQHDFSSNNMVRTRSLGERHG
jgi:hypothetical protein